MTIFKKILIGFSAIAMLSVLGILVVSASAKTTLTVENIEATPGSIVDVAVNLSGNEVGILGMMISVSYDEGLTLKSAVEGTALSTLDFTPGKVITANPINLAWDGLDADKTNGTIAVLTFEVSDSALGKCNINLSYDIGNIYDNDYNDIDVEIVNGCINVSSVGAKPEMTVHNYIPGDNTTFTLDISSFDDIEGKILVATYYNGQYSLGNVVTYDAVASRNITVNTKGMDTLKIMWWNEILQGKCIPISKSIEIDLTK